MSRSGRPAVAVAFAVVLVGCAHTDETEGARPRRKRVVDVEEPVVAEPVAEAPPPAAALLTAGMRAPDVAGPNQDDKLVRLKDLRGKYVVLYFFLQDFHPGCTLEARRFRNDSDKYEKAGATIVGVSADKVAMQREFADKESLKFPLLADPEDKISRAFGVPKEEEGRRVTFVIDKEGVIRKVFDHVRAQGHSAEVLAALDELNKAGDVAAAAKKAEDDAAAKKAADEAAVKKAAQEVAAKKAAVEEAKAAKKANADEAIAAKKAKAEEAAAAKKAKADAAKAAKEAKGKGKDGKGKAPAAADGVAKEGEAKEGTEAGKDDKAAPAAEEGAEKPAAKSPEKSKGDGKAEEKKDDKPTAKPADKANEDGKEKGQKAQKGQKEKSAGEDADL